jgi:hypothetical protein
MADRAPFFFLQILGLSINLITRFALVVAIGVVADDAIASCGRLVHRSFLPAAQCRGCWRISDSFPTPANRASQ